MKKIRIALRLALAFVLLLVVLRLGAYAKEEFDTRSLSRNYAAAHPEIMQMPAGERVHSRMLQILDNLKETSYEYISSVDESQGVYRFDCSLLAGYIVRSVAPEAYRALPVELLVKRPRAKGFQRIIASAPEVGGTDGWRKISLFLDSKPGDIIVWGTWDAPLWRNSGHVMLVLEPPVQVNDSTARVIVMDASSGPHAGDTRKDGQNGVGVGTMWFGLDSTGAAVKFHWDNPEKGARNSSIVVGRVVDR